MGLSKKETKEKEFMDRDNSLVISGGRWVGGGRKGYGGINGDEKKINKEKNHSTIYQKSE